MEEVAGRGVKTEDRVFQNEMRSERTTNAFRLQQN